MNATSPTIRSADPPANWWPMVRDRIDHTVSSASADAPLLRQMSAYIMDTGGKRWRARLPIAVAEAVGADAGPMIPFAAACEMLHNASLVHDDIQDGDTVRRGQPTVWRRFGTAQGINLGNALLYYALLALRDSELPAERLRAIEQRVLDETLRVINGQVAELVLRERCLEGAADNRPRYMQVAAGKTGAFWALPLAGAAFLCGLEPKLVDSLDDAARHFGVLFQVRDDVLDLWGDKGRGRRGNDVREGKPSYLVVHCLDHCRADEAGWLRAVLARPAEQTSSADVEEAIALFERYGSRDSALEEIERQRAAVLGRPALAGHPVRSVLADLCDVFASEVPA